MPYKRGISTRLDRPSSGQYTVLVVVLCCGVGGIYRLLRCPSKNKTLTLEQLGLEAVTPLTCNLVLNGT